MPDTGGGCARVSWGQSKKRQRRRASSDADSKQYNSDILARAHTSRGASGSFVLSVGFQFTVAAVGRGGRPLLKAAFEDQGQSSCLMKGFLACRKEKSVRNVLVCQHSLGLILLEECCGVRRRRYVSCCIKRTRKSTPSTAWRPTASCTWADPGTESILGSVTGACA